MPDTPQQKARPHPAKVAFGNVIQSSQSAPFYVEPLCLSNFSFLQGASHPDELISHAAASGYAALAITDINTLGGVVRAHAAAKVANFSLVVGTRIRFIDYPSQPDIALYPTDLASYGRLCQLLTLGKRRAPKGDCYLGLDDLKELHKGLLAVLVPPPDSDPNDLTEAILSAKHIFSDDRLSVAAIGTYDGIQNVRLDELQRKCRKLRVPAVASNDPYYHTSDRRALQDVLTCIRHGCTLNEAGFQLLPNAERHLKSPTEMHRLFATWPEAIARGHALLERTRLFSLELLRYEYPHEVCPTGLAAIEYLKQLTHDRALERYPDGVPDDVSQRIQHELLLIGDLNYATYFLTCYDIVQFARERGILCQGRGAAANSAVCYCLGITNVDPTRIDLLFERFISRERNEPPDIDIDFEHERREEVIQYLYKKFGRDRAGLTAVVVTYRGRSAIRDVGKTLGMPLDLVDSLARTLSWWDGGVVDPSEIRRLGLDPDDTLIAHLLVLTRDLLGFPRHLSQHPGGFVLTERPLSELVPIENAAMPDRTIIEWDKDDIDALGMLKIDVLALGMLTCIGKCLAMRDQFYPDQPMRIHQVPQEDPSVYDMISQADTVGVFQIESRAQMSMLPRLQPRRFYDLVIEVAIVRPGPIQGNMVHPYLRRRRGQEPVEYPSPQVRSVLEKTLGVPLFQEQAMKLAVVAAGFTPGEADQLRRAMAAWKRSGQAIYAYGQRIREGMINNGYTPEYSDRLFEQIKGFGQYGFPESHAASFAHLVYVSSYIKYYHPAIFCACLINSQPMGFYAPAQIIRDAQQHGVRILPIDINESSWDCTVTPDEQAVRLGFRLVKGLSRVPACDIPDFIRRHGRVTSIVGLLRHAGLAVADLRALARADAFNSLGLNRQQVLWQIRRLKDIPLPLFDQVGDTEQSATTLPVQSEPDLVLHDYAATGLSLKAHPITHLRDSLSRSGVQPTQVLKDAVLAPHGKTICIGGLVLVRQRPGSAKGITFMTLEDETHIANLIVRPQVWEHFRSIARDSVALIAEGEVQRDGAVVHVLVRRLRPLSVHLASPTNLARNFR